MRSEPPIVLGILAAAGQLPTKELNQYECVRSWALAANYERFAPYVSRIASKNAQRALIVASANADEAALVEGCCVLPADYLLLVRFDLATQSWGQHQSGREPAGPRIRFVGRA